MTMDPDPSDPTTATPEPTAAAPDSSTAAALAPTPAASMTASAFPGTVAGGSDRIAGKTRPPVIVWLLGIVSFGIYFLYWYYKVNQEVRDYDGTIEVEPVLSLLAQFVPIVSIVSMVRTAGRISRAQATSGTSSRCSGLIGFLLIFVLGTWVIYYQSELNKVWAQHGSPAEGTPIR